MAASLTRTTINRAVHLRITPRPKSLAETREILRILTKHFGAVEYFRSFRYDAIPVLDSAVAIFKEDEAAARCLRRSPIRFRMGFEPAEGEEERGEAEGGAGDEETEDVTWSGVPRASSSTSWSATAPGAPTPTHMRGSAAASFGPGGISSRWLHTTAAPSAQAQGPANPFARKAKTKPNSVPFSPLSHDERHEAEPSTLSAFSEPEPASNPSSTFENSKTDPTRPSSPPSLRELEDAFASFSPFGDPESDIVTSFSPTARKPTSSNTSAKSEPKVPPPSSFARPQADFSDSSFAEPKSDFTPFSPSADEAKAEANPTSSFPADGARTKPRFAPSQSANDANPEPNRIPFSSIASGEVINSRTPASTEQHYPTLPTDATEPEHGTRLGPIFQILVQPSTRHFRDLINMAHYHGQYQLNTQAFGQHDLVKRVPVKGLSDVNWRAPDEPWRFTRRRREEAGWFDETEASTEAAPLVDSSSRPDRRKMTLMDLWEKGNQMRATG